MDWRWEPQSDVLRQVLNDQAAWLVAEARRMGRPSRVCPCVMCRSDRSPVADDDAAERVDNSGHVVVDGQVVPSSVPGTDVERQQG